MNVKFHRLGFKIAYARLKLVPMLVNDYKLFHVWPFYKCCTNNNIETCRLIDEIKKC